MSDHTRFLATIAREPDNMDARLVFADWLEERGDQRAEYIRLAIELANLPSCNPKMHLVWRGVGLEYKKGGTPKCPMCVKRAPLLDRCAALLTEHRREWTMAGLPPAIFYDEYGIVFRGCYTAQGIKAEFRRGFPEILTLRFEEWQRHYETLRDAMPVREVRLTTQPNVQYHSKLSGAFFEALVTIKVGDRQYMADASSWDVATCMVLSQAYPGHDAARPIRYTLPQPTLHHGTLSTTDANGNTTSIPVRAMIDRR